MTRPTRFEPDISVVVPTRDRPLALARCLDALESQSVTDTLEVIVVDDGSADAEAISSIAARHTFARIVRREGAGPAAARNAGARVARGSVVCFTDDDCVPGPAWAGQLARAIREGADAVAGVTVAGHSSLAKASELVAHAPASGASEGAAFAPSNNLAVARSVFESVPFDESYPFAAGEDREWCARLNAAGHVFVVVPDAVLLHEQALTLRSFLRQQVRYGAGAHRFRRHRRRLESPAFYLRLIERGFRSGLGVGVLVLLAQAATAVGYFGASRDWARRRDVTP